jgi:hypothetical protein
MKMVQYLDQPPVGWFVLDIKRSGPRAWDWVALMIDIDPDEMQNCFCEFPARFYVHPNDYSPESRITRQCWVRVAGKHRNRGAARDALKAMMTMLH